MSTNRALAQSHRRCGPIGPLSELDARGVSSVRMFTKPRAASPARWPTRATHRDAAYLCIAPILHTDARALVSATWRSRPTSPSSPCRSSATSPSRRSRSWRSDRPVVNRRRHRGVANAIAGSQSARMSKRSPARGAVSTPERDFVRRRRDTRTIAKAGPRQPWLAGTERSCFKPTAATIAWLLPLAADEKSSDSRWVFGDSP
jgi:hypothetical protein